jgi:DNA-binding transcriptional MerR regulator
MLSIGQFARACGLTAKTLRHYDAIGLLAPAVVEPVTCYRRYHPDQVDEARLIRKLRAVELPIVEVRRLLGIYKQDADAMTAELVEHRRRLDSRVTRLQHQIHQIDHLIKEKGWQDMGEKEQFTLDPDVERKVAAKLFNRVWELLETENRTEAEDAEMIHSAHASACHWMVVGKPENRARGEWQCSRVYSVLGHAEAAMFHAQKVLEICQRHGFGDFDLAFAYEALARAAAVGGDGDESRRWAELARAAAAEIAGDFDRELVLSDLETIPAAV